MSKKVAYIFAGQGSQAIGMGKDFYENSNFAKNTIDEVSEKTGIDFKALMFEENKNLEQTEYTQPAILLVGYIAFKLFQEKLKSENLSESVDFKFALGHSLGEFTALTAVGALNIENAVQLVHKRGKLMKQACENIEAGMMAVIGLSDDIIEEVCETARAEGKKVWSANFNSDGQVVIAGIKEDLQAIEPLLKEKKAKRTVLLNMSVASHCDLLSSATDELKIELEKNIEDNFETSIISNVTAKPYSSKLEAVQLLTEQLISPVKYTQSVLNIADEVDLMIEFGHGIVLKGLNRRIVKAIPTLNVSDFKTLDKTIETLKN
jgi:[acyl-carrier-protein] S-malonyltransferase